MISETPSNMASSRSHCIFPLAVDMRKPNSDVVRRSKLHLVDLAGSERVKKTGIEGTVLREARYINLSLHFLEQVIISLQERHKFVPYRNSMMTSVLRDSLGGNCKTVMVATVSPEELALDESVSTCRFAQRVALISNRLELNEEIDPKLLISRLKAQVLAKLGKCCCRAGGLALEHEHAPQSRCCSQDLCHVISQVRELKEELQLLRGEGYERSVSALSEEERHRCEQLVRACTPPPPSSPSSSSLPPSSPPSSPTPSAGACPAIPQVGASRLISRARPLRR